MADQANDQTVTADSAADGETGQEQQPEPQPVQQRAPLTRTPGRTGPRDAKTSSPLASAFTQIRAGVATLVFTIAVLSALVLALGAVLTALGANESNTLVAGVIGLAGRLDGPFADIFTFDSAVKQTLVNWAIAAAAYLIAGRVLQRLIGP